MNEKELVISVIGLVSKALHKNKAFTRIRLFCGGDQLMKQRFNYGLGLKRASPNSMKAFFCHLGKILSFFVFDAFCVVLA
ncbi:hypothetical protein JT210_01515 [Helicobacter pylori]|uniref:hypothetical protein n=1 Tax=Helicobacter pylori TaxID=210 RepID=UPI0020B84451|nr:hypothetical protein [Helicobacter pylori]MCP3736875.1 hypothetical protein [Helicobacter pylori]